MFNRDFPIDDVNQIIADLYDDTVALPQRMDAFFHALDNIIYFEKANFLFYEKSVDSYKTHSFYTVNWTDTQKNDYQSHFCSFDDVLPILDSDKSVTFLTSQLFNPDVRKSSKYFKEFLLPMGLHDSLETNFSVKNSNLRGIFSIHRPADKLAFSNDELNMMKLFQPHFCHIFKDYGNDIDLFKILQVMEPHNGVGMCFLDKKFNMVRYNSAFESLLGQKGVRDLHNNPITNKIRFLCNRLETDTHILGKSLEYKMDDCPIYLEVSKSAELDNEGFFCTMFDLCRMLGQTLSQVRAQYDLTPRELDILNYSLKGYSNEQASKLLYISVPTVKKHLASIYSKMDITSQKQILTKINLV
ncbi:MAG: helix-turn-helix transcriptional regulator [Oscillospiraceae bacterium]